MDNQALEKLVAGVAELSITNYIDTTLTAERLTLLVVKPVIGCPPFSISENTCTEFYSTG